MTDNSPTQFPPSYQVGDSSISGIALARIFRFLIGAIIVGVLLAYVYRSFLGNHSGFALLCGAGYAVLCAFGAYVKVRESKSISSNSQ